MNYASATGHDSSYALKPCSVIRLNMTSYFKEKITGAQSEVDSGNANKYFIQVAAGTSYDDSKAKQVIINGAPTELNKNAKVA
ncbi:hypothetical protein KCU79_g23363, partial [Aureobasidium melanogenum]